VFVVASGPHSGATEQEVRTMREAAGKAVAVNSRVSVFATSPHNHVSVVGKSPELIVGAIEHVVASAR
jgi:hypothetical protein